MIKKFDGKDTDFFPQGKRIKISYEMQKNNVIRLGFMGHFLATKVNGLF